MFIVAAVLAGLLVGWVLTRRLATLGYRRPDETGRATPASRWWLIVATGAAWGWLVFTLADQPATVIVMWLPLSAALGWISAVDLDVQRIPNLTLGPTAIWVAVCLIALAITEHPSDPLLHAVIAGAGCFIGFAILHIASPNALGFGDVKLAAILGAAIGVVSLTAVLAALLFACILALTWATATRTTHLAFGPWIAAGAILGVGLPALSSALA
ncbi:MULTISPECIES: A24 family peptidase [Propionibacteriales]|jgi:leader peptidase (prepilin peptidase)/N-methyltransferase|uniref:A24 family peptidase n=1 Tax=Propionibacteriales TaxID=85009 RepID=UPI002B2166A3|nr:MULTISPECIES: A24 family peptidase [Propionibacteriales]MEA4945834.1 A24 family peptidase [Propionicimonas sp.]MEA5155667.1 A24 family peptidase [Raineyella sp.]